MDNVPGYSGGAPRTPPAGLQVIGILNIVFGVLGAIPWLLAVLGSSFLAIGGGAAAASGGDGVPVGGLLGALAGLVMVFALIGMAMSAVLIAAGVGVLKMAPWGRTLSMIYAVVAIVLGVLQLPKSLLCGLVGLIYPVILLVLMNQQEWKDAFSNP